jgi:hypothetical protein
MDIEEGKMEERSRAHPQIPVHLICNNTSPNPGFSIGASAILIW